MQSDVYLAVKKYREKTNKNGSSHVFVDLKKLIFVLLNPDLSFLENTVDPDQVASDEAI